MAVVQEFLAYPHSDLILLVAGGLLTIIGFFQVVRKGFALFFWLLIFTAGLIPVVYVFKGSDVDFLSQTRDQVVGIGNLAPGIRDDVIKVWCDKLDEAGL